MSALQTFRPLKRNRTETELGVPTKLGGSKCWNRGSWSQFIRCSRGWERVNRDIKPYRDTVEIGFAAAKKKTKKTSSSPPPFRIDLKNDIGGSMCSAMCVCFFCTRRRLGHFDSFQ